MTGEVYEAETVTSKVGRQAGRVLATLIGAAALVVGAFLDWIPNRTGDRLTLKALAQTDFGPQSDLMKTVGGLSILIALVAVVGLADRTGWLTRVAGSAALVVFVLFAAQAFRYFGHDLGAATRDARAGVWFVLAGGLALLIGGFLGASIVRVPATIEAPSGQVSERPKV